MAHKNQTENSEIQSEDQSEVSKAPKENAKQAIALCHDLIFTGLHSFDRHEQIKAALTYLQNLFKQIDAGPDVVIQEQEPAAVPVEEVNV